MGGYLNFGLIKIGSKLFGTENPDAPSVSLQDHAAVSSVLSPVVSSLEDADMTWFAKRDTA